MKRNENRIVITAKNWDTEKTSRNHACEVFKAVTNLINGEQLTIEIDPNTSFEDITGSVMEIAETLVNAFNMISVYSKDEKPVDSDGYDGWLNQEDLMD